MDDDVSQHAWNVNATRALRCDIGHDCRFDRECAVRTEPVWATTSSDSASSPSNGSAYSHGCWSGDSPFGPLSPSGTSSSGITTLLLVDGIESTERSERAVDNVIANAAAQIKEKLPGSLPPGVVLVSVRLPVGDFAWACIATARLPPSVAQGHVWELSRTDAMWAHIWMTGHVLERKTGLDLWMSMQSKDSPASSARSMSARGTGTTCSSGLSRNGGPATSGQPGSRYCNQKDRLLLCGLPRPMYLLENNTPDRVTKFVHMGVAARMDGIAKAPLHDLGLPLAASASRTTPSLDAKELHEMLAKVRAECFQQGLAVFQTDAVTAGAGERGKLGTEQLLCSLSCAIHAQERAAWAKSSASPCFTESWSARRWFERCSAALSVVQAMERLTAQTATTDSRTRRWYASVAAACGYDVPSCAYVLRALPGAAELRSCPSLSAAIQSIRSSPWSLSSNASNSRAFLAAGTARGPFSLWRMSEERAKAICAALGMQQAVGQTTVSMIGTSSSSAGPAPSSSSSSVAGSKRKRAAELVDLTCAEEDSIVLSGQALAYVSQGASMRSRGPSSRSAGSSIHSRQKRRMEDSTVVDLASEDECDIQCGESQPPYRASASQSLPGCTVTWPSHLSHTPLHQLIQSASSKGTKVDVRLQASAAADAGSSAALYGCAALRSPSTDIAFLATAPSPSHDGHVGEMSGTQAQPSPAPTTLSVPCLRVKYIQSQQWVDLLRDLVVKLAHSSSSSSSSTSSSHGGTYRTYAQTMDDVTAAVHAGVQYEGAAVTMGRGVIDAVSGELLTWRTSCTTACRHQHRDERIRYVLMIEGMWDYYDFKKPRAGAASTTWPENKAAIEAGRIHLSDLSVKGSLTGAVTARKAEEEKEKRRAAGSKVRSETQHDLLVHMTPDGMQSLAAHLFILTGVEVVWTNTVQDSARWLLYQAQVLPLQPYTACSAAATILGAGLA